ncbi:hypothetical protein N7451_002779 [Penicillium sp. IBT 35674x]|nr:hypothetical protein N7451_002779 [Penicillium sp. IBT 35674x]
MSCLWRLGTLMLCEYLVSSAALAFTTKKSNLRRLCILCLVLLAIPEIRLLSFLPGPELLRGVFAFSCIVKLLHFISLFLILKVEIHQLIDPASSYFARFCAGLNCVTSPRGIKTLWEVKTWPECRELPKHRYIAKNVIVLAWQYLLLDVVNFGVLKQFHLHWPGALAAGAEFVSAGSTKEQLMARLPLSFILVVNLRLLFTMVYGVLATLSVLLGFTSQKDWPPLFGSMRHLERFSIRSFWA